MVQASGSQQEVHGGSTRPFQCILKAQILFIIVLRQDWSPPPLIVQIMTFVSTQKKRDCFRKGGGEGGKEGRRVRRRKGKEGGGRGEEQEEKNDLDSVSREKVVELKKINKTEI